MIYLVYLFYGVYFYARLQNGAVHSQHMPCSQREANGPASGWIPGEVNDQEVPIMRVKVTLACTECKRRNYVTKKNKRNNPERIEMNKHCKFCRKHTLHKETK